MNRTRTAASLAALAAITGALVFGGALAANADAGLEITTTTVAYGTFEIRGTATLDNGSNTIEIRQGTSPTGSIICAAAIYDTLTTSWVCTTSMDPGVYTITAWQAGSPGSDRADTADITVQTPLPDYNNGDPFVVTAGDLPSFGGDVTAPNGDMTVNIPGVGSCTTGAYPGPGYTWSCEVAAVADAAPGDYPFSVTQTSNGVTSAAVTATLRVNPGPITITSPADGSSIPWTGVPTTISGTVLNPAVGDVQLYYLGEANLCSATPAANGTWSCTSPGPLALGSYPISATQNVGPGPYVGSQFDVVVPRPVVTSGDPILIPYAGSATIGGTVAYSTGTVQVTVPSLPGVGCTAVIVAAGPWECVITLGVEPAGTYAVEIVHTVAGAGSQTPTTIELRIGQPSPAAPVIDSPIDGAVLTSGGGNWLTITGRAPLAWTVDLNVVGYPYSAYSQCKNLTVDYNATWSCAIDLESGSQRLVVSQDQGGSGVFSSAVDVTVQEQSGSAAPTLNCSFSPDGGFTVSSPQQMAVFELSRVSIASGSSLGNSFGIQGACNGSTGSAFPPDNGELYFDFAKIQDCLPSCSQSGLVPGLYEVYYTRSELDPTPGLSFEPHSYVFRIPEAPAITNVAGTTNSVRLRGTGSAGDLVRITRSSGATLCSTTVTGAGDWACTFPKSSTTAVRAIAVDPSSGGMSARSALRSIPVAPVASPEDLVTLSEWSLEFDGDLSNLKPGDKFTLHVSGMPVGTKIEIWMHSEPRLLGTITGTGLPMDLKLQVPADIDPGAHEIEMIAVTPLGTNYEYVSGVTVLPGDKPLGTTPLANTGDDPAGDTGTGGPGDYGNPGAPSGISGTLAPLQHVLANPSALAIAGGLALALLFLVALPTELLNSSLTENTSRLGRVYGVIDRSMTRAQDWLIKVTHSRAAVAILVVLIVAVIYGFIDPGFGFNIVSLRLVLSMAIAFFLLSFVASWLSRLVIQRLWGAIAVIAIQPSIILFAVIGVVVARILDFSPGFLVGMAIGLELIQASKRVAARAVFVQIGFVVGLSLVAWVVYSFFTPGNDFFGMLLDDTMVATTAEGLTGALIAVFPLTFLDGRQLWEVSKRLWAAAFVIVATAFSLLVLPTAIAGTNVADIGTWLIVFAVFGGLSFAVWLIFARADRRVAAAEEKERVDAA